MKQTDESQERVCSGLRVWSAESANLKPPPMTSLIKIFRFKKPKEADDVQIKRNEESRFSLRCSPVPTWRSSKDAIYIGGASWSRPSAPYSIITAPKKGRPTRSCPGGVLYPPSKQSVITGIPVPIDNPPSQSSNNGGSMPVHETKAQQHQNDTAVKTSEYGSCEPSPTNVSNNMCTLPDSDYDNDYVTQLQQYECELRKLRRRLKEERHRYREHLIATQRVQNECDYMKRVAEKATRAVVVAQRSIESERHKNQNLRRKLRDADVLISSLQCELRQEERRRNEERLERGCCASESHNDAECSLGAGEALCALSHSTANLYDTTHFSTHHFNEMPDEVRNFRTANRCESPSVAETPQRSSTPTFERSEDSSECTLGDVAACGDGGCNRDVAKGSLSDGERNTNVVRRSFSDSELPALIAARDRTDADTPQRRSSPQLLTAHPRRLLANHTECEGEATGSCSSDEDFATLELIGKQLRRRGDVVRFIPPRRTVRTSTFRQFGQRERTALAEFDYLHELSTDASGIASSPDCPRVY